MNIVDDIATNQMLPRVTLEAESHTTLEAADGDRALQILAREKMESISDVLMPGMDGYPLCFEIRRHPEWKVVPFRFYTATYSSPSDEKLALDLGADAFLKKPSPTGAIVEKLNQVIKEFEEIPPITTEQHMVPQILVNLVRNAMQACEASGGRQKRPTGRVNQEAGRVRIAVADNGSGILPENLIRIFPHGFTTKKHGHGFGQHSAALAAREMGGSLTVHSDGPGQGASFTLELPCQTSASPGRSTAGAENE